MTEKLNVILSSILPSKSTSISIDENLKTFSSTCKICGIPAHYSYFGVLSCESCKMFFKRNAKFGQEAFKCDSGGHCEINISNRHVCTSCRLAKCFRSGMNMKLFRPARLKRHKTDQENKKKSLSKSANLVKIVKQDETQMLPRLNLLQSDISTLTTDQWNVLSNLVHSYDERKVLSASQRLVQEDEHLYSMKLLGEILSKEFFSLLYETTDTCLRSNNDLCALPFENRSILLRTAADCITCFGGIFSMRLYDLNSCRSFLEILYKTYGELNLILTIKSINLVDPDIVLSKLALFLLIFSKNTFIFSSITPFDNESASIISRIQNIYAEIIWKYLLYKYGYYQAVQRFMHLIQFILSLIELMYHIQSVRSHVNAMETIVENTEMKLILDDIEEIDQTIDH